MYVKKFEADTLDDALKHIKRELGPDAIILKTVTNKGLKGAFKKKKIEITAAISEKSYVKKAHVDQVLNDEQKDRFYQADASKIAGRIDAHAEHAGYGGLGLNKAVVKATDKIKSHLDDFLGTTTDFEKDNESHGQESDYQNYDFIDEELYKEVPGQVERLDSSFDASNSGLESSLVIDELEGHKHKILELEKKIYELSQNITTEVKGPNEIEQLRYTLRALDLSEKIVKDIIKKALFELNDEDLNSSDTLFDFALRELEKIIVTDMPTFSKLNLDEDSVFTVLLSDAASGQSSILFKLAALKQDCLLIQYGSGVEKTGQNIAPKLFDFDIHQARTPAEIVSMCRKAREENKSVFIDFRNQNKDTDETKHFVDGLRRGFKHVEILICLSAIHSELYNNKEITKFKQLANGLVVSHMDLCLNYGAILNLCYLHPQLPLKFFGTGEMIPDDIESATSERLLSELFDLK